MKFQTKIALVLSGATILLLTATWAIISRHVSDGVTKSIGDKLTSIAVTVSLSVDGDQHEKVATERSMNSPLYRDLRRVLQKVKLATQPNQVTNIYTLRKTGNPNVLEFILDADESDKSAKLGQTYDVSTLPELRDAFNAPVPDKEINRDQWGEWLSGYAPLYNAAGEAVAVVGVDARAEAIRQMQAQVVKSLLLILVIGIVVSFPLSFIVAGFLSKPIKKLVKATKEIGAGNLDYKVEIDSLDEMGVLGNSFNQMTAGLKERDFAKQVLNRYVSKDVAEKIMGAPIDRVMAGERRHVSVIFVDVRGFTSMSEDMKPDELLKT